MMRFGGTAGSPGLETINASDDSGNPLDQSSGFALAGSPTLSSHIGAGGIGSAKLSSGDATVLAALSPGNSAEGRDPSPVPEPSTLLLVLVAVMGLAGKGSALRRVARRNDY
jgi:hypothetical protein